MMEEEKLLQVFAHFHTCPFTCAHKRMFNFILRFYLSLKFMCVDVLTACMSMLHARCLRKLEKGIESPETRVTKSC